VHPPEAMRDGSVVGAVPVGGTAPSSSAAQVLVAARGSTIRLVARGHLGSEEAHVLDTALARLAAIGRRVTLDLSSASAISAGVHVVVDRHTESARRAGRGFHVIVPPSAPPSGR
jgi:hypothetical protein